MLTGALPRVNLAHLPTPIEPLKRLGAELGGPRLYVKRDDLTGLATGGNKARKLEFLLADALAQGADTVVTCGAAQSNQARQAAAAAARLGLGCVLVLLRPAGGGPPQGNWLLDELLGAEIRWAEDWTRLGAAAEAVAEELREAGRKPYLVPYGASNGYGVLGYVAALEEIAAAGRFGHIVVASSSGGTQAGLVLGARLLGYPVRVLGISIDSGAAELQATVAELANEAAALLGANLSVRPAEVAVNADYLGGGYGVVGEREREAILLAARTEGLVLDPVYTGRALGGLADLIRRGAFPREESVLFVHTGGIPALFAYAELLGGAQAAGNPRPVSSVLLE
ncbi:MAG: pyridoxal-phosphate dependent enzyme [Acidobacteriota bacterium]